MDFIGIGALARGPGERIAALKRVRGGLTSLIATCPGHGRVGVRLAAGRPVAWLLAWEGAYLGRCLFSLRLGEQITQVLRLLVDCIMLLGEICEAVIDRSYWLSLPRHRGRSR